MVEKQEWIEGVLKEIQDKGKVVIYLFSTATGDEKVSVFKPTKEGDPALPAVKEGGRYLYQKKINGDFTNLKPKWGNVGGKNRPVGYLLKPCEPVEAEALSPIPAQASVPQRDERIMRESYSRHAAMVISNLLKPIEFESVANEVLEARRKMLSDFVIRTTDELMQAAQDAEKKK